MASLLLALIYMAFISLGLPDALMGAAWPSMYPEFGVSVSYMGMISMTIAVGTVVSSLLSDRLNRRFGTGIVTAVSVAMTALALMGFSFSNSFWMLFVWAIPYGLGAGGVDAALNNYVALHYASRHMSWLHCMWGIGASTGPYIMGYALTSGVGWSAGYRWIGIFQILLTAVLLFSIPVWKRGSAEPEQAERSKALSLKQIVAIPGAKEVMLAFFGYCAIEQTAGQWASSYLVMKDGMAADTAASLASLYYLGITAGRAVSGFMTMKFTDKQMIRMGQTGVALGIAIMLLPFGKTVSMIGLLLMGLGSAPIYPCVIHSTPEHFGADRSQAIIGVQMASAYAGTLLMPMVYGVLADFVGAAVLPVYLLGILAVMIWMLERLNQLSEKAKICGKR